MILNGEDSLKGWSDSEGKFYLVYRGKWKPKSSIVFTYFNLKTIVIINADFLNNSENIFIRLQEENCPPIPIGLTGRLGGLVIQQTPPPPLNMFDWLRRL